MASEDDLSLPGELRGYGARQWIGLVLGVALFLALGLGLKAHGLPHAASWAAASVALMSVWWICEPVPLWVTACMPVILFPCFGVAPESDSFLQTLFNVALQYFDPLNWLFLGGMFIAASIEQWNLHKRVALGVISFTGTSPPRLVLGFMLATAFLSLWIANTTAALMMYPIAMAVLSRLEEDLGENHPDVRRLGIAVMLGLAYAASIGGLGTKIGTGTNGIFINNAHQMLHLEIDFVTWLKVGIPLVVITLPLVWLYLTRVAVKLPSGHIGAGKEVIQAERARLGPMTRGEVVALTAFVLAALLWIFRKPIEVWKDVSIPGWWELVTWTWADVVPLNSLPEAMRKMLKSDCGDGMVALVVGLGLLLIPVSLRPWRPALTPRRAAGIGWGLLVLLGGGFAMAYGIQSSGLSDRIAAQMKDVGQLHPFVALLIVCGVTTAITEVASNTATASILVPILAAGGAHLGLHPATLMFASTLSASFGLMLPAGTPPNAIVYASGYLTVPRMVLSGFAVDFCSVFLVATLCYYLVPWALGLP
ncbi:MAG: SLC13 family permease [Planctomycetes bacterium]|nr:SLC13 family permease [Planctomycetota bacterium]